MLAGPPYGAAPLCSVRSATHCQRKAVVDFFPIIIPLPCSEQPPCVTQDTGSSCKPSELTAATAVIIPSAGHGTQGFEYGRQNLYPMTLTYRFRSHRQPCKGDNSSDEEDKERVALVVHPGTARLGSPDDEFFQKVQTVRQTMVKLESKVRELEKQQVTILATPLPEESMKQDLQNLRDEIKQLGREIRAQLKAIEPQKEEADENYNSVNTRMRKTQHGVLSQQFVELINKCNSMQSEYREKNVERIRRQLKITNAGMVSDEELEQMLDSGQSEVFVSNILKDTQVTRQALNEISARHSEIQQLERSIRELHEIFTFLATEVEMQGEMINRIEKNILSSADYVERGQEHVKLALENQKKARKKKVMIIICVSITVLILAVIIGITTAIG
ncbi:Syntaxin-4 [Heterocephalus glaber]|uniref:Syntaxin-4 n=1 Tax=Heterocephalus glaber TaxID=10181 RepID=G5BYD0_HETGA|nr:Syntaxin-4 [Heterocephalus glaber]